MRKFFAFLALASFLGFSAQSVFADLRDLDSEGLTIAGDDDFRKRIRVRNTDDADTDLVNGDVVIWDIRSATNSSLDNRWSVTTTTVAADPRVAGVATEAITQGTRGWIQTYGIHTAARVTGTINPAGTILETSTTRGRGQPTGSASLGQYGKPLERNASGNAAIQVFVDTD